MFFVLPGPGVAKGTLKDLSVKFFGTDYATPAAQFDLAKVGQTVP